WAGWRAGTSPGVVGEGTSRADSVAQGPRDPRHRHQPPYERPRRDDELAGGEAVRRAVGQHLDTGDAPALEVDTHHFPRPESGSRRAGSLEQPHPPLLRADGSRPTDMERRLRVLAELPARRP